ncbi:MAG: hypothetical protein HPY71_05460 [Firmicutes bacterium]|nr:hypothetical protein [Bacillota bacterium]
MSASATKRHAILRPYIPRLPAADLSISLFPISLFLCLPVILCLLLLLWQATPASAGEATPTGGAATTSSTMEAPLKETPEALQLRISGEISHNFALKLDDGETMADRISYRLSFESQPSENTRAYLSWSGSHNLLDGSLALADLDEAYMNVYLASADLRIGRQAVSWGTADGFNPTSFVSPNSALSLASGSGEPGNLGSLSDLKGEPVLACQVTVYPAWGDITGVAVLEPALLPTPLPQDAQGQIIYGVAVSLAQQPGTSMNVIPAATGFPEPQGPSGLEKKLEIAGRVHTQIGSWDVYGNALRGWEPVPALWMTSRIATDNAGNPLPPGPDGKLTVKLVPEARYRKATKLGIAAAGVLDHYTLWAEAAYTWPDAIPELDDPQNIALSSNRGYAQLVLGGDRSFDKDIYASVQLIYNSEGSLLNPYLLPGQEQLPGYYATGIIRYAGDNGDNKLELVGIGNLRDGSIALVPRYTHQLAQAVELSAGLAIFTGRDGTEFGELRRNGTVFSGVKVSF